MESIVYDKDKQVATIILNRPEAMNAFNYDMLCELEQVVEKARIDPDVRVVKFIGAGERAFSVGADLKERKTLTDQEVKRNIFKIGEVFSKIEQLPQPTLAIINGYAFGGGMELALACDFRFAGEDVGLGLTETSLGIIPGAGGTQRLPRIVGETKALELILTAERLLAHEAEKIGLVTKVSPLHELNDVVDCFISRILANAPIALQQAKFAIKEGMKVDLQTGLQIERKAYELTIPTEDRTEALTAFAEKRKPIFKGR
ncbi:enoyl-CoA hydratase-related protein [Priestia flexa]|uniref:enoyl-CoA hydratase-related protein n=1 Tax=Priestia flexa TaxID=86664 RepID=UPI001B325419|nr:enoyl-CoA hydratase-related protein [Priestia flexa]